MKSKYFLFLISIIFLIIAMNNISAIIIYGKWQDGNQNIQINLGDNITFDANFYNDFFNEY